MTRIRTLIVDDERPARLKIRRFLEREPDVETLADAVSGTDAVHRIRQDRPALVFLDVQMPGLDGFGVIASLDFNPLPTIVFVTAHDEFAIRAFEVHAVDYLLKPFDSIRFKKAVDRAIQYIKIVAAGVDSTRFKKAVDRARQYIKIVAAGGDSTLDDRLMRLLERVQGGQRFAERLIVNSGDRAFFVHVEDIRWVESARNYVRLHTGSGVYELRGTIEGLQSKLDPRKFLRVNRSQIVNLDNVKELRPWFHGEFKILLKDGTELSWSRRFIDRSTDSVIGRS